MKPAIGEMLVALHRLEAGPLVDSDRPLIERSDGEGIALGAERHGGETKASTHKRLTKTPAREIGPEPQPDLCHPAAELHHQEAREFMPRFVIGSKVPVPPFRWIEQFSQVVSVRISVVNE
jgi:hypothetical protein